MLAVVVAAGVIVASSAPVGSDGCGGGRPVQPPGTTRFHTLWVPEPTLPLGSHLRSYLLRLPASYDPGTPHPVLIDIHGYTSDARTQSERSGFAQVPPHVAPDAPNAATAICLPWPHLGP